MKYQLWSEIKRQLHLLTLCDDSDARHAAAELIAEFIKNMEEL